jgi:hypothetical protein
MNYARIMFSNQATSLFIWAVFGAVLGTAVSVLWKHTGDPVD